MPGKRARSNMTPADLTRLRQRAGLTQAELAVRMGLKPSYQRSFSLMECGKFPITKQMGERIRAAIGDDMTDADRIKAIMAQAERDIQAIFIDTPVKVNYSLVF